MSWHLWSNLVTQNPLDIILVRMFLPHIEKLKFSITFKEGKTLVSLLTPLLGIDYEEGSKRYD